MCNRALCSSSSFSLCHATPARVRFRTPSGTRMRSNEQEWFFRNYLPERLIPHLHVCEIPLHNLLIHCRDVHTFVETRYPSPATLSSKRCLCVSDSTCSQLPMNILSSEDSPSACGSDAALPSASNCSLSSKPLFGHLRLVSWTVDFRCPWRVLCSHWRMEHRLWRCPVSLSHPLQPFARISLVSDPIPLTQHDCGLMKRVALVSLHPTVLCSLARYSLPSSLFSSSARILFLHVSERLAW